MDPHPEYDMTSAVQTLSAQALKLQPKERLQVVEQILDSLDQTDASIRDLWAQEAQARLDAYRRGEISAVALPDVIAKYAGSTFGA